jgi:hypothetical protein
MSWIDPPNQVGFNNTASSSYRYGPCWLGFLSLHFNNKPYRELQGGSWDIRGDHFLFGSVFIKKKVTKPKF